MTQHTADDTRRELAALLANITDADVHVPVWIDSSGDDMRRPHFADPLDRDRNDRD